MQWRTRGAAGRTCRRINSCGLGARLKPHGHTLAPDTLDVQGSERALGSYQYQDGYGGFVPVNPDSVNRFKWGLERCFRAAVNAGGRMGRQLGELRASMGWCSSSCP